MASASQRGPLPASRDDFQIAIICALPEERDTVEALMTRDYKSEKRYGKARGDDNSYTLGELGGKPIVLVSPSHMGTIDTSHLASSMRCSFPNLALALVVGIAGGAPFDRNMQPSEIHLGDVLISTQVIGYDVGASYDDKFERKTAIEDILPRAPALVTSFLNTLKTGRGNAFKRLLARTQQDSPRFAAEEYRRPAADTDRVYASHYRHKHQDLAVCETCSKCQERHHPVCNEAIKAACEDLGCQPQFTRKARAPKIHFGRVASGNGVMKSARSRDTLIQTEDCIGFEMEGASTWELYGTIVVKGVVDYADSHKNKRWRLYPAVRAALCAEALVEEIELSPVTATTQALVHLSTPNPVAFEAWLQQQMVPSGVPLHLMLERISKYDPYMIHSRLSGRKSSNTTDWLKSHPTFQSWLLENTALQSRLWLSGKVGSGKSTLMSVEALDNVREESADVLRTTAVDQCLATPEPGGSSIVLVFFFTREANTALALFESFTKQLVAALARTNADCPAYVRSCLNSAFGKDMRRPDISQTVNDLVIPLCRLFQGRAVLLDGIDMCDPAESDLIWWWLKKILAKVAAKVLVSSQDHSDVSSHLSFDESCRIRIDQQLNDGDIGAYIDEQIANRSGPGHALHDKKMHALVKDELQRRANGMFLWVHLVLQIILHDCATPHAVEEAVRSLPRSLEEVYSQCVTRKRENKPLCDAELLIWVCAAPTPLSIDAVRELLAIDMETGEVLEDMKPFEHPLLQSGVGLIQLDSSLRVLLPAHHTVCDFVLSEKARSHFRSALHNRKAQRSWVLSSEIETWSEQTFRSALGALCLCYIETHTSRSLRKQQQPIQFPVPPPPLPWLFQRIWPRGSKVPHVSIVPPPSRATKAAETQSAFLRYAIENWVLCNRSFVSNTDGFPWFGWNNRRTSLNSHERLFEQVALERNDSFSVHPWPAMPRSPNSHLLNMFAYAVANDHLPLLQVVEHARTFLPPKSFDSPLAQHGHMPAIHVAAKNSSYSVLPRLIQMCDINTRCSLSGKQALHYAAEAGSSACVVMLLGVDGVDAEAEDWYGETPLSRAAKYGQEGVVKALLASGKVDADLRDDEFRRTPLSRAAENGHEGVVKVLLATGKVDADLRDGSGWTPLSRAAENGHEGVVKALLATGKVDADSRDEFGQTPLSRAAENGHEGVVKALLATGKVDADLRDGFYKTPLSRAAENGHEGVVKALLATGKVHADSRDWSGWTPLSRAVENGHEGVVKALLATGKVDADSRDDEFRRTPLSRAAENGHEGVVKALLATGKVDADSRDGFYKTPLWWAAKNGHEGVVKALLATGKVDADSRDGPGRTPLSRAAENGHEGVVKALLASGKVDADLRDDEFRRTPLSRAAENGHEGVVKALLASGKVDADSRDGFYKTPLWWAAENGHEGVVKALLASGKVDADLRDGFYKTPLSRAAENGHEGVVKLGKEYSRRRGIRRVELREEI